MLAIGSILVLALPSLAGWIPLWAAVALHEGSTLLVALNSLRLLRVGRPAAGGALPNAWSVRPPQGSTWQPTPADKLLDKPVLATELLSAAPAA